MLIKVPMFYREYSVVMTEVQGNYIPCMPSIGTKNPITRVPVGSRFQFIRKVEEDLYEIEMIGSSDMKCLITSHVFQWILPVYRKKR